MVEYFKMASPPQVAPGGKLRLPLVESNRSTGGAFQIWQGEELLYQGSQYGNVVPEPAPDVWRPIGLLQRQGASYSIFLYIPTTALPGAYELRIATTVGSRSGPFVVG
jgi:hypothetical protein